MGLGDLFKAAENKALKQQIKDLQDSITPEMQDSISLRQLIETQKAEMESLRYSQSEQIRIHESKLEEIKTLTDLQKNKLDNLKKEIIITQEEILIQSVGLYEPKFDFANSTKYKDELDRIRDLQKDAVKKGTATTENTGWTVNGDARKGAKMIRDMQKLVIRAFNTECDDVISKVKFSNIESSEKRIRTSCNTISNLGSICHVSIRESYLKLKIRELYLAYEYQVEKQKEKDILKQLKAEERERAKLEKEIIEARKKIEKEKKHYTNALAKVLNQIKTADASEIADLDAKRKELESELKDLDAAIAQVDYREANQKAGYVYIISNIGAFGEGVYKIGMTRRLDPMDRIDELGDASVPFDFDVHALIFSENAPALEAALHRAFESRRVNMINSRREFFRVSLDEIKTVVQENYDKTVEFIDVAPAEQFRQTLLQISS